ncbi:helix-turn-helix domain-containing protein [Rhodococcus oxybenzonivorans]|uniref:sigma-54-dependent Fis family transcriptional regulator n=1 Tax=Rhodococcus oxybenzonivorans TaxID=1990687 RepID=UPI002954DF2C|nr:helix-turn-helix domain-containing protein [Rhodococcus oxybenzonivorans]MDV7351955.1 helix-turn-helix domain-containing protein [Rhodococcus oxybenzonivorans]
MLSSSAHSTVDARPEIASSWMRSQLSGLDCATTLKLDRIDVAPDGCLRRAATPVLERVCREFDGAPLVFVLADHDARILDIRHASPAVRDAIDWMGIEPGIRLAEDEVGTNAVGTVLEARQPLLVHGPEHFMSAFHEFSCFGQPIIHPITRRLEGVLDVGGGAGEDHRYFAPIAQRLVGEIQDRLALSTPIAQRNLLAAFHSAARRKERPVMVLGEGMVLATPAALDLLDPADHAAVRASAGTARTTAVTNRLTLESGREVEFTCTPVDGGNGVLVDFATTRTSPKPQPRTPVEEWPLLVVGETGTGRTTEAVRVAGPGGAIVDAADVVHRGEQAWAVGLDRQLEQDGAVVIIENVHFLTDSMATLVARLIRGTPRHVVLTSTSADDDAGIHPSLVGLCAARRELAPLRRRRHEIPALARRMLAEEAVTSDLRLASATLQILAAHPWPGNLTELRRVIHALARTRSAGDIIPTDLSAPYREVGTPLSPIRHAEREVIVAAIEAAGGNKLKAAQSLGVSRSTLYNRLRVLKIA